MAKSIVDLFPGFIPGSRLIDGGELEALVNGLFTAKTGIVAAAGGGQTNAALLQAALNSVDTVGTAADSVMLPLALPGAKVEVLNNTATSMQVFGAPTNPNNTTGAGDTIAANGSNTQQPTATGVAHAGATIFTYECFAAGQWRQR